MSNGIDKLADSLYASLKEKENRTAKPYDAAATVTRISDDGKTAWVHIDNGVDETPVQKTTNARVGDSVMIRISGHRAWLLGNKTNPATDDARANQAYEIGSSANIAAQIANQAAQNAVADAGVARQAAEEAQATAEVIEGIAVSAQESADAAEQSASSAESSATDALGQAQAASASAVRAAEDAKTANDSLASIRSNLIAVVDGATTVEKAVSVMQTAIESVLDYDASTDTTQQWFWHDANGAHILSDTDGYRNDLDDSGMKIIDVFTEQPVAEFGVSVARVGKQNANNISITNTRMSLYSEGAEIAYLDNQRFKSSDIVATNLYMQTIDASTGTVIGQIGWVMRSNGHLSLKLIK